MLGVAFRIRCLCRIAHDAVQSALENIRQRQAEAGTEEDEEEEEEEDMKRSILAKLVDRNGPDSHIPAVVAIEAVLGGFHTVGEEHPRRIPHCRIILGGFHTVQ